MSTVSQFMTVEPLKSLLEDPTVTEIMVNGFDRIFIERKGMRIPSDRRFESEHALRYAVERLLEQQPGARVDMQSPMVDIALPDGSRVNIVIAPVVIGGPHLTVRKFLRPATTAEDFVALGTMDRRMAWFLSQAVQSAATIVFSGGTGSGKTTMLEVLASYIDPAERIITIEDTLELHLRQPNCVRLIGRMSNVEGEGVITLGQLFRNSLRMRPNRIILGEIRGREAVDFLQAITSGHRGSMAVIHAANAREALLRIESLAMMAGRGAERGSVLTQISEGIDLVVQLDQHHDGVRRVVAISEVVGDPAGGLVIRDLFRWVATSASRERVEGRFEANGIVPECARRMRLQGVDLPDSFFAADDAGQVDRPAA